MDQLQNKWDREHKMKEQELNTFGSNTSMEEFRQLSKSIPWATVVRSYYDSQASCHKYRVSQKMVAMDQLLP